MGCLWKPYWRSFCKKPDRALYPAAAVNVLNAGISGDNASGALARLERDVLSRKPDLVTVNLALNDAMNPDVEAGLAAYAAAMGEIMDRVLASGAECMLVTPNFMCARRSKRAA